jgi:hypothetical protein
MSHDAAVSLLSALAEVSSRTLQAAGAGAPGAAAGGGGGAGGGAGAAAGAGGGGGGGAGGGGAGGGGAGGGGAGGAGAAGPGSLRGHATLLHRMTDVLLANLWRLQARVGRLLLKSKRGGRREGPDAPPCGAPC